MNTATLTPSINRNTFLRRTLNVDAATCLAMASLLVIAADPLATILDLDPSLLEYAGISLFPTAAFMLWLATRVSIPAGGVWLVIIGNVAWVLGSILLLLASDPSMLGYAFVIAQAIIVAVLAEIELIGLRRNK